MNSGDSYTNLHSAQFPSRLGGTVGLARANTMSIFLENRDSLQMPIRTFTRCRELNSYGYNNSGIVIFYNYVGDERAFVFSWPMSQNSVHNGGNGTADNTYYSAQPIL